MYFIHAWQWGDYVVMLLPLSSGGMPERCSSNRLLFEELQNAVRVGAALQAPKEWLCCVQPM